MIDIKYEAPKQRSAAYDGETLVGECDYMESEGLWTIVHTGVEQPYTGRGIAKDLVAKLVDEARKAGVKIRPLCRFAVAEFARNKEYQDVKA